MKFGASNHDVLLSQLEANSLEQGPHHPMDPDLLCSWKEIADYIGRGVRTVQRWERDLELPVRRSGSKGVAVYARKREIDHWLHNTPYRDTLRMNPSAAIPSLPESRQRMRDSIRELKQRLSQMQQLARDTAELAMRFRERQVMNTPTARDEQTAC